MGTTQKLGVKRRLAPYGDGMGREGIHLFQFSIRGIMHAGPYLCGQPVDMLLSDFRFRRLNHTLKAKFQFWCPRLSNAANTDQEIEMAAA